MVSANNPFQKCTAANLTADGPRLEYDIVCPGRGAAKGHATYVLSADTFSGSVAIVTGGKNMTMTEMQQAHRIGGAVQQCWDQYLDSNVARLPLAKRGRVILTTGPCARRSSK